MEQMKLSKILSLILAVLLVFGLCACDGDGRRAPTTETPESSSSVVSEQSEDTIPADKVVVITPEPEPEPEPEQYIEYVYVSRTGKCYHSISYCSNMQDPLRMTKSEAIDRGRRPCQNCY